MQIYGSSHVHGPQGINPPHRTASRPTGAADRVAASDQLDISREAELVSQVRDLPDVRAERVAQVRAQIQAGNYETSDKLDIALGRLLDEFSA